MGPGKGVEIKLASQYKSVVTTVRWRQRSFVKNRPHIHVYAWPDTRYRVYTYRCVRFCVRFRFPFFCTYIQPPPRYYLSVRLSKFVWPKNTLISVKEECYYKKRIWWKNEKELYIFIFQQVFFNMYFSLIVFDFPDNIQNNLC